MIAGELAQRADELATDGEAFVSATVVRVERPTSVRPGDVAIVREDGAIEGFIGGVCAQHSVRLYALRAIERGEPLLLRILGPDHLDAPVDGDPESAVEVASEEGAVTVQNPCLSGGSIEVFLEPFMPAPRMLVVGESPIAQALTRLAPDVGLDVVATADERHRGERPQASDLALVVAAHGRDELEMLRAGLAAGVEYIGLVASRKRGAALVEELRDEGIAEELLGDIDYPAGFALGAQSPGEIAVAILARIIQVRRMGESSTHVPARAPKATTATDPICGMTIVVGADTPQLEHDGETVYFCCEGCRRTFEERLAA
jgi:xanthine dehydrogenase accessory factor